MGLFRHFTLLAGLIAGIFFASTGIAQDATVVRRAAFDIGSAAIKCTIADVDIATGKVIEILDTLSEKVDFAQDVARSYDTNLSTEIMDAGIKALEKIKTTAVDLNAVEYSAAGGSVFRDARNGRAYFVRIEEETGIPSRVISEQQAALLSYHAAHQAMQTSAHDLVVWDIGGGTMQISARHNDGGMLFYLDPMGSIPFKNVVIGTIQKKNPATVTTPNPISVTEVQQALTYITAHAAVSVPAALKSRIQKDTIIVAGIGGVHYYSVPEVLGGRKEIYTREEVTKALKQWTGKNDEDFESEYAETRLSNLILVLGYMNALNIDRVHPLKINQADGLLTAREFW